MLNSEDDVSGNNQQSTSIYDIRFRWLIVLSFACRLVVAGITELGNDEVYYWTYALFPDWSHFDHPPMVGWVIQLFTLNLLFDSTLMVRLGSVVLGTISLFLVYRIGKDFINARTGLIAAVLFAASPYVSVISGTFIMPDAPLVTLWLLALWLGIGILDRTDSEFFDHKRMLLLGGVIGLAMISKYHAASLWFGIMGYIVFFDQRWLTKWSLYLALLISALCLIPVVIWNVEVDFISFRFHGDRVGLFQSDIRPDYFFSELFGQMGYQNPINYVLIVMSLIALIKGKKFISVRLKRFLLWQAVPLIVTFLVVSLWRRTLPHWSGPAYLSLILLASAYVSQFKGQIPKVAKWALGLLIAVLTIAVVEIKTGLTRQWSDNSNIEKTELGKYDVTLDMSGWKRLHEKFEAIHSKYVTEGVMNQNAYIVSDKWFPAAHLDFYVATPMNLKLYAFGSLNDIHKYAWINEYRGMPDEGTDAYYISHSRLFRSPEHLKKYYQDITPLDTIEMNRGGKVDAYYFLYKLEGYLSNFENEI